MSTDDDSHLFPPERNVAQLRIPPHSMNAESSVLGSLLLDNASWDRVGDLLTDSDFYRNEHRLIYAAIGALVNSCKEADVITVNDYLENTGKAQEVGGLRYLNSLAQFVSSAANVRRYAHIVRENSLRRKLISAADEISTTAFNPGDRPIDTIVDEAAHQIIAISPDAVAEEWQSMEDMVVTQLDSIQERSDATDGTQRVGERIIPTGIGDLDEMLDGGMRDGKLIIVGARPSHGKSALADTIGLHVAMIEALPVAKFSMEMENYENGQRAISSVGRIPLHKIRRPERMGDLEWASLTHAVEKLRHVPFYSNERAGLNIHQLRAKARALHRRLGGLGLILVDYLQLMSGVDPRIPRTYQLEEASRGLKAMAKELKCPVIALAQVKREVEKATDPMPTMSDLKDCGSLEQDADVILFLDRPWVRKPGLADEWKFYAKGQLAKQRGGRTGTLHFQFDGQYTRYSSWPSDIAIPTSQVVVKRSDTGTSL